MKLSKKEPSKTELKFKGTITIDQEAKDIDIDELNEKLQDGIALTEH